MAACVESECSTTSMFRGQRLGRLIVSLACRILIPSKQRFQALNGVDMNFGLELIGTQPPRAGSEAPRPNTDSGNAAVGLDGKVLEARNADTWASDLQRADRLSRLPDPTTSHTQAIGPFAHAAAPQFPGKA
jgi:hypothetical protein